MNLHIFPKKIAYRAFPLALKGATTEWFELLATGSIDNIGELACLFLTQLMAGRRKRRLVALPPDR